MGRYRYAKLPVSAGPVRDMFQWKIDEIFKDIPNIFGIVDTQLLGFDNNSYDHDGRLRRVMQICR